MKILMVTQSYPPFLGGEERHVRNLGQYLCGQGHTVSVVTFQSGDLPPEEMQGDIRVHRIPATLARLSMLRADKKRLHAPPAPDPEAAIALGRIVMRERPDIVHGHNWLARSFLPVKAASGAGFVMTLHDHSLICPKKKLIFGDAHCSGPAWNKCPGCASENYGKSSAIVYALNAGASRWERSAVDRYICVSHATARDTRADQLGDKTVVIPNFVPDDIATLRAPGHPALAQLPAGPFMLFVGALGRYKGVDVLLQAYAQLTDAPPLVIIGYETQEYPIRTTVMPPNVVILRNVPHEAVMEAWHRCTFGLVPSTWSDPCPTVAMEALACGKPVIVSDMGGLPEIVRHGETGLVVRPDDVADLRSAMQALLASPELLRAMGDAAAGSIDAFKASTVGRRVAGLYEDIVAERRR